MSDNGFGDPVLAQRTRDVLTRQMIRVMDQERPNYQYGEVTQIDPDLGSCLVRLNGDSDPVRIAFGEVRPHSVGQIVRVSGNRGDRHISGVMGGAVTADPDPVDLLAPANFDMGPTPAGVHSVWDPVDGANKYELQLADDAGFSINLRSYETVGNNLIEQPLPPGTDVHGRVRALTSYGGAGAWSLYDSTEAGFYDVSPSDGAAPSASPSVIVTGGLGMMLVEWLPVSNVDTVIYEVHMSLTNGFVPVVGGPTKCGETSGTFFTVNRMGGLPPGVDLLYGTTYYFRVIAKDKDGEASPGGQGSGQMLQVGGADVLQIPLTELGDGVPPTSSPTPVVTPGIGFLFVKWDKLSTLDYTVYDIHVSTVNGFTPDTTFFSTRVGGSLDDFFFIRKTAAGIALNYSTTYYVKIVARDIDGMAAASPQASGQAAQASTPDIAVNAITAASGIIADLTVGTAKIQDAAITSAKVGLLQVTTALIADAAIENAKIANLAVDNAKIGNLAVNNAKIANMNVDKLIAGTIAAQNIALGAGGNLYSGGALGSGAGFLLNNGGLSFYNAAHVQKFFVSATTGDLTATGGTLTGMLFRTAGAGLERLELTSAAAGRLLYYSGDGDETDEGYLYFNIQGGGGADRSLALLRPSQLTGGLLPQLTLGSQSRDGSVGPSAQLFVKSGQGLSLSADGSFSLSGTGNGGVSSGFGSLTLSSYTSTRFFAHSAQCVLYLGGASDTHIVLQGPADVDINGNVTTFTASAAVDTYAPYIRMFGGITEIHDNAEIYGQLHMVNGHARGGTYGGYAFTFLDYNGNDIHFEYNGSDLIVFINGTGHNLSNLG